MPNPQVPPSRILVVGAGFIGSALIREARHQGIGVRVVTRSESRTSTAASKLGAEVVIADAADALSMAAACRDVDNVYYTVGDLRTGISDEGYGGDLP